MDPVESLISGAIHYEVDLNKNPYITLENIILRLYRKIMNYTHVQPQLNEKTILFKRWHEEILSAYNKLRSDLSHDERIIVERVLSKDAPHISELIKFANYWYKRDPTTVNRWFAVDGIISAHPKSYAQEAFALPFSKHNEAIRALYAYESEPKNIKKIVETAFLLYESDEEHPNSDPEFQKHVTLYTNMVGEEIKWIAAERKGRSHSPQPNKRKKGCSSP